MTSLEIWNCDCGYLIQLIVIIGVIAESRIVDWAFQNDEIWCKRREKCLWISRQNRTLRH